MALKHHLKQEYDQQMNSQKRVNQAKLKHIFRTIDRERDESMSESTTHTIDFEFFKRALIRICIQG